MITQLINTETFATFEAKAMKKKFQNIKMALRSKKSAEREQIMKTGGGTKATIVFSRAELALDSLLGQTKAFVGEPEFVESQCFNLLNENFISGQEEEDGEEEDKEEDNVVIPLKKTKKAMHSFSAGDAGQIEECVKKETKKKLVKCTPESIVEKQERVLDKELEVLELKKGVLKKMDRVLDQILEKQEKQSDDLTLLQLATDL